ncbi:MAG: hypothetical protein Q4C64_04150 [Erysipelotrichia bacterium]|nr:hypothetical protein [Erysipelotrichia bacterium]
MLNKIKEKIANTAFKAAKEKVHDYYESHKETINTVGIIAVVGIIYSLGKQKGYSEACRKNEINIILSKV